MDWARRPPLPRVGAPPVPTVVYTGGGAPSGGRTTTGGPTTPSGSRGYVGSAAAARPTTPTGWTGYFGQPAAAPPQPPLVIATGGYGNPPVIAGPPPVPTIGGPRGGYGGGVQPAAGQGGYGGPRGSTVGGLPTAGGQITYPTYNPWSVLTDATKWGAANAQPGQGAGKFGGIAAAGAAAGAGPGAFLGIPPVQPSPPLGYQPRQGYGGFGGSSQGGLPWSPYTPKQGYGGFGGSSVGGLPTAGGRISYPAPPGKAGPKGARTWAEPGPTGAGGPVISSDGGYAQDPYYEDWGGGWGGGWGGYDDYGNYHPGSGRGYDGGGFGLINWRIS